MDKLKKYIRCGFKILTTWKFIVFFLGLTFITYYIQMNRYVIYYPAWNSMVVHDRITQLTCVATRQSADEQFVTHRMKYENERGCFVRHKRLMMGYVPQPILEGY